MLESKEKEGKERAKTRLGLQYNKLRRWGEGIMFFFGSQVCGARGKVEVR